MKPLVLIVDDDELLREFARICLEKAGYAVETACDGEKALRYLVMGRPDLLLIDVNMPGMSGLELIDRIRLRRWFKDTPVLVFSSSSLGVDIQAAARAGAGYLLKPFSEAELVAKVAAVLERARPGPGN